MSGVLVTKMKDEEVIRMNIRTAIFLLLGLPVLTCFCGDGLAAEPTIYTVGYYLKEHDIPCYWRGTTPISLRILPGADNGHAESIFVSDGTVYTAGSCGMIKGKIVTNPSYWTGTTPSTLPIPSGASSGWSNSIFVSKGTVYNAGEYFLKDQMGYSPCYWEGKKLISLGLPPGGVFGTANSICVRSGIVYISGTFAKKLDGNEPVDETPCYWKGKTLIPLPLPSGASSGKTTSMFVTEDGTTYISGYLYKKSRYIPCYWKGKSLVSLDLPPGGTCGVANSIVVSEGKVYTAGSFGKRADEDGLPADKTPCYWTGTTPTVLTLSNGSLIASAYSIFVYDGIVYVAGDYCEGEDLASYYPCYWAGNDSPPISLVPSVGCANGIFVK
jgi:hypothetical protein